MAGYLSQGTLRLLVIGLVCLTTVAMGAATITSTVDVEGDSASPVLTGDMDDSDDLEEGVDEEDDGGGIERGEGGAGEQYFLQLERCNEFLDSIPGTVVYFAAISGVIYLLKRRYSLGTALIGSYALAPIALMGYFLNTTCVEAGGPNEGFANNIVGGSGSEIVTTPEVSPVWLLVLVGLLLVAAMVVAVRASGDQTVELETETEDVDSAGVADLAAAAGAAADRLEEHNADVDNAVYRAWWEMTRLLDMDNQASATPGEFAEAAVNLGMSENHVNELTRLFEEVRYGEHDAEDRESDATDVFREIEDEYGQEDTTNMEDNDGR